MRKRKAAGSMLALKYIHRGMKAHFAARLAKKTEHEIALALEDEAILLRKIEDEYNEHERPKVQANIQAFLDEFPQTEKRRIRVSLLLERMKRAKEERDITYLRTLVREYQVLMGLMQDITPEDVLRAREYPITEFIKSRKGMASCPFHTDKTPSMDVRKNFFHCYSCGESGDAITLAMRLEGLTFAQAIKRLT